MRLPLERWVPDARFPSVGDLPWDELKARGKTALVFDLDNTLGPWGVDALSDATLALLEARRADGFRLGILSNARTGRGAALARQLDLLGVPIVLAARKPARAGYARILDALGAEPKGCVMIGDQWLTDVVGAKRMGMGAILVEPVDPRSESRWTRLRRRLDECALRGLGHPKPAGR